MILKNVSCPCGRGFDEKNKNVWVKEDGFDEGKGKRLVCVYCGHVFHQFYVPQYKKGPHEEFIRKHPKDHLSKKQRRKQREKQKEDLKKALIYSK